MAPTYPLQRVNFVIRAGPSYHSCHGAELGTPGRFSAGDGMASGHGRRRVEGRRKRRRGGPRSAKGRQKHRVPKGVATDGRRSYDARMRRTETNTALCSRCHARQAHGLPQRPRTIIQPKPPCHGTCRAVTIVLSSLDSTPSVHAIELFKNSVHFSTPSIDFACSDLLDIGSKRYIWSEGDPVTQQALKRWTALR